MAEDGEKPIEEIKVGDKVLAKDETTGDTAYKEVLELYQREVEETYNVIVGEETITTTDEHPFWVVNENGWVEAKDLKVGDLLVSENGQLLPISDIIIKKEHKVVYNFMVKDYHSYFVGNLGIWTHNACDYTPSGSSQFNSWLNKYPEKNYSVYLGYKNSEQVYVGITNDLKTRQNSHGNRFELRKIEGTGNLTKNEARTIEQVIIDNRGMNKNGGKFENSINSVSPKRDIYPDVKEYGNKWLIDNNHSNLLK